jgi:tetratricopeptide (TPR) repeat protein
MLRGTVLSIQKQTLPQSIATFRKAEAFCAYCSEGQIADNFDRLGMPDSALVYYEKWARASEDSWDSAVYWLNQPAAYFRMGELYEAKGDKVRAIDFYGRFTELWRDADPDLQPRVKEAKRRIAELQKSRG